MGIKKGFTLAEVLITLVIIGVIAAITIPSLMNKTNEQETVVAVKKAYSVLSQAYQRVIAENGEINPATLGENATDATKTLGKMFAKQLNTQKVCGMATDGDCFANGNYVFFDGSDGGGDYNSEAGHFKMTLSDGMSVAFFMEDNSYVNRGDTEPLSHVIAAIDVDINGDKGPNTYGKDLHFFVITKYGIIPNGTPADTAFPLSSCRVLGFGCTAWVITKGNMDYLHKDISW